MHMLTSHSVEEILLPRYVNRSTNFSDLPFDAEIAPSCLKLINSVLSEFIWKVMPLAACS